MKKLALKLALLCSAALLICSCNKNEEYPMFWTWLEDIPSIDMESAFTHMEEAGLEIKVYAWVWTLNPPRQERAQMLAEHPDWFSVNRNGESVADHKAYVNSYKFLCPALPEVREYLQNMVRMRFNKLTIHSYPYQWYAEDVTGEMHYAGSFFYGCTHRCDKWDFLKELTKGRNDSIFWESAARWQSPGCAM